MKGGRDRPHGLDLNGLRQAFLERESQFLRPVPPGGIEMEDLSVGVDARIRVSSPSFRALVQPKANRTAQAPQGVTLLRPTRRHGAEG